MSADVRPALLGGPPAFGDGLPLTRVALSGREALQQRLTAILDSGMLTNGATVRELEERIAARLGVAHAVAVANCTAGLMLVYQALGVAGRRVVLPSFTFAASAHAAVWAGAAVDFADVDPATATLDPADVDGHLDGAAALSATHVYGTPCDVEALQKVADEAGVPVVYDAAHALGSVHQGVPVGRFGTAEVFSLSPTKVVVAGEGGIVTTGDPALAGALRIGRDYGNPGDYDCRFPGLNARLSELHAAVALASLDGLDERIEHRNELARVFAGELDGLPGIRVVVPPPGDRSTFKDLTVVIDARRFGVDAAVMQLALRAEGIDSRRYYHPPIHRQQAYAARWATPRPLPVTDELAASALSPPLWSHMDAATVRRVAEAFVRVHDNAGAVARAASGSRPLGTIVDGMTNSADG